MTSAVLADILVEARSGYWGSEIGTGHVDARVIRNGDVQTDGIRWDALPLRAISDKEYERAKVHAGDIVLTTSGDCGVVAYVDEEPEEPTIASNFVRLLRFDETRINSRYAYHLMNSERFRWQLGPFIRGATLQNLSLSKAVEEVGLPIPIPDDPRRSLAEQKRIAAILDKADAIRQRRRDDICSSIDDLLASGFAHLVGADAADYSKWEPASIESLAAAEKGSMRTGPFGSDLLHSEFVDEGVAVLGIDNAVNNRFCWAERRFVTEEKYERLQRYRVFPNDVIVTIMGTTGRSAVVPEDIPVAITTKHLATITVDRSKAEPEFVSHAIYRHPAVLSQIAKANRGAIMSGLNLTLIKQLEVPLPPPPVQKEFASFVTRVRQVQDEAERRLVEAENLFNSIVQRAFRGEL